jgi:hypothetical protein
MIRVLRLGEWQGDICIHEENSMQDEPMKIVSYWPIGIRAYIFYRDYGEHMKNVPVRYSGSMGIYEIYPPGNERPLKVQLTRGAYTKPIHIEKVPYPCPKVRKGTKTRYLHGEWWKYLQTRGWLQI